MKCIELTVPFLLLVFGSADASSFSYPEQRAAVRINGLKTPDNGISSVLEGKNSTVADNHDDDLLSFNFVDNTNGYCVMDEIDEIEQLDQLFNRDAQYVEDFLLVNDNEEGFEEAKDELKRFVAIVRSYLPAELENAFTDRQILSSIMQLESISGPTLVMTQECVDAIENAFELSLVEFNKMMNVGDQFFSPTAVSAGKSQSSQLTTNTWSYLLRILEDNNISTFSKFKDLIFGHYEIFDARRYFDEDWRRGVRSWQELTLSGVSIVAKYTATYLTDGELLASAFNALNIAPALQILYDNTLSTCVIGPLPTTPAPASPPVTPPNPTGTFVSNDRTPMVAVIDEISDSLSLSDLSRSYNTLRASYPNRRLCLLQPRSYDKGNLKIPNQFFTDSTDTIYRQFSSDNDDTGHFSNWFNLCDLDEFPSEGVTTVALYIDTSRASSSRIYFERQATRYGMSITEEVGDGTTNWISPFLHVF